MNRRVRVLSPSCSVPFDVMLLFAASEALHLLYRSIRSDSSELAAKQLSLRTPTLGQMKAQS